jgi:hypothetical protein
MSVDPHEAALEDAYLDLYEEHRKQALKEFHFERLQSHFLSNPELAKFPVEVLAEAKTLASSSPRAALALASSAAEVGVKAVILKPLIMGLVQSETVASLVADLAFNHQGIDRFRELLFAVLREFGGIDLSTHHRDGASASLWQEIQTGVSRRNRVLHRCESATHAEALDALGVAGEVLEKLVPALAERLGMHIHDGSRVCNAYHLPPELEKLLHRAQADN